MGEGGEANRSKKGEGQGRIASFFCPEIREGGREGRGFEEFKETLLRDFLCPGLPINYYNQ